MKTIPVRIDEPAEKKEFKGLFVKIGTPEAEFGTPELEAAYTAAKD